MNRKTRKMWALALTTGAVAFQTMCAPTVTAISSVVTAGGVIWIITRIVAD